MNRRPVRPASEAASSRWAAASSSRPLHSSAAPSRARARVRWSPSAAGGPVAGESRAAAAASASPASRPGGPGAAWPGAARPGSGAVGTRASRPTWGGEPRLGGRGQPQPGVGLLQLAEGEPAEGGHGGQLRGRPHPFGREPGQQLPQGGRLPPGQQGQPRAGEQPGRLVEVAAGQGVADGLDRQAVGGVPGRRPPVQAGQLPGVLVAQLGPEQLGEQGVVAVPGPPGSGGRGEDVLALQAGQHLGAVRVAGQGVGQLAAQPVRHRGPQQERPQLGRLDGQHLLEQVAGDGPVVAGQLVHEPSRQRVVAQGQGGQPQPGRPALGPAAGGPRGRRRTGPPRGRRAGPWPRRG
jgi:hypothetical protein